MADVGHKGRQACLAGTRGEGGAMTVDPKSVVANFFATFSTGDVDRIMDAFTDDASWWVSGTIAGMSGTNSKQQLGSLLRAVVPLYKEGALKIWPTSMIAEGNKVAAEAESYAELNNGKVYNNRYHFLIKLDGDKVRSVKEYSDTHHMLETFS
jgi:ketosteroid isomerase-like protein